METVKLLAQRRQQTGKGSARRLRRAGKIPAVVYGHGVNEILAINGKDLVHVRHSSAGENVIVDLCIEGEHPVTYSTIMREVQIDPVSLAVLHVDFYRVAMDEPIRVTVPLVFVNAPEERLRMVGAQVTPLLREIEVECLPGNIPDALHVDLSTLEIGEVRRAGELPLPPGIRLLTDAEEAVVTTVATTAATAAEAGAAESTPEEPKEEVEEG